LSKGLNDEMTDLPTSSDITLGILAGGRGTRLGGLDKAWLQRGGEPQVLRWQRHFAATTASVLVSSNAGPARYTQVGLAVVADRLGDDLGPIAGLDALANACRTPWLLTIPVDLVDVDECLLPTLISASAANGACARDDDGAQPLVALWRVASLREALAAAGATVDPAVHRLQSRLGMSCVHFDGVRFGNLNTPADLAAAGISLSP